MATTTEQRKIQIIADGSKASASIKEMRAAVSLLNNELNKLPKNSQEFIDKSKQYKTARQNLNAVQQEAKNVNTAFTRLKTAATNLGLVFGVALIASKIYDFFSRSSGEAKKFEKALSQLSSITGAKGKDLAYYANEAERIGATTTLSASQAVDAFKLIGSAAPELLKVKEELVGVTESAVTLAEAAGITLPQAATALTTVLNQFDLDATEAKRVIDVLAQGSVIGSGDINYLNDAIRRFGPAAKVMNVSLEESAVAMEVMAKASINSEQAGTSFRNILIKLSQGADEFNPQIVGLRTALENLKKKGYDDAGEAAKFFGSENQIQALAILNQLPLYDEFAEKISKSGVAMEQAAINTDNYEGDLKSLNSATESLQISIGKGLNSALRPLVQLFTQLIIGLKEAPAFIKENKDLFAALGVAILTLNAGTIAATASTIYHTAVEKGRAIAVRASAVATRLLDAAMTANPVGLMIKAVALLATGFVVLYNRSETVRAAVAGLGEAAVQVFKNLRDSVMQYLGGVGNLLVGIFTLDTEKIKQGLTGAFNGIKDTYLGAGRGVAEAYEKGRREKMEAEAAETLAQQAEQNQAEKQQLGAHTEALLEEEQDKQDRIREINEENQRKLEEERAKQREAELAAERAIQDLRVAMIEDDSERELAALQLAHERKLETLSGNAMQIEEQKRLLEQQFEEERAEILLEKEEAQREKEEMQLEEYLTRLDEEEALKAERIEQQFLQALTTEQQRDQQMLNLQAATLEQRLAILEQSGQGQTTKAEQIKTDLLRIEKEKVDRQIEDEMRLKEAKQAIQEAGYSAALDIFELGIALSENERKEKGKNAQFFKSFSVGKILVDSAQEIAAIWKNANSNPLNALIPGFGVGLAVAQTALALNRTRQGIQAVNSQGFAGGGFTGRGLSVDGLGKMRDQTGHAIAGVVHADEWVAPKWMVESPKYANVIGWMESERTRRFAEGGFTGAMPATAAAAASAGQNAGNASAPQSLATLEELQQLRADFRAYAARVDRWASTLKVNNDPRDISEGLNVINQIDNDSSIR